MSIDKMANIYGGVGFWFMARSRMLLGVGLPLIFVPIMAAVQTDQASALMNAAQHPRRLDRGLHRLQRADTPPAVGHRRPLEDPATSRLDVRTRFTA